MKVILVDTPVQKISLVEIGFSKLKLPVIYSMIGCSCIAAYQLFGAPNHTFYCDDEALFKNPRPPAFLLEGYPDPVYGRILIFKAIGEDEMSPTISVEDVFSMVFFLPQ